MLIAFEGSRMPKTKKNIISAMRDLLEKKPFVKITVNDICATADIGRSTFYLHFDDKFALTRFLFNETRAYLNSLLPGKALPDRLEGILDCFREDRKFNANLLSSSAKPLYIESLTRNFYEDYIELLTDYEEKGHPLPAAPELIATFYASGLANTLIWWMETGYPVPAAELADCHNALTHGRLPLVKQSGNW